MTARTIHLAGTLGVALTQALLDGGMLIRHEETFEVTPRGDLLLAGWGVRDSNWDFSSELQRQLGERMSVTAGYYFNTGGYFRNTAALSKNRVTDNILVVPTDYDTYCVTAPANPGPRRHGVVPAPLQPGARGRLNRARRALTVLV